MSAEAVPQFTRLGKYRIDGVLGQGAMGVVYKAFDPNIDRAVAIKTIHKSLLETDMGQELLGRFHNEAKAVGRLQHSNIVSIYEFDQYEGTPFFAMELVDGKELRGLLRDGVKLSLEQIVKLFDQILDGLAYTHSYGIVHRDIKPGNIFVLKNGGVKIADFGIARVDNSELTMAGSVLGTPSYMSPEQCMGQPVDPRSDLFSTAVMLYEVLTGQKTFKGETATAIMHNVVSANPEPPSKLNAELPPAVDELMKKALAKNPQQRFQSATEFKAALDLCLTKPQGQKLKRQLLVAGAALGVIALLGAGGYWIAHRPQSVNVSAAVSPQTAIGQPAKPLTAEDVKKIDRLLQVAKAHFSVGRLVSPQGSNAYEAYQQVLAMDPSNQEALKGVEEATDRFYKRAKLLWSQGDTQNVKEHLALAAALFPNHEGFAELRKDVEAAGK